MSGYRVADESPADPLAIDAERCRKHMFRQHMVQQIVALVITGGLWLPGLMVWWLFLAPGRIRRATEGYRVQIRSGAVEIGNASGMRSVALDAITTVSVLDGGIVSVAVRHGQPVTILGLVDPVAASRAIVDARDAHVRELRPDLLPDFQEAGVEPRHRPRRRHAP